MSLLVAAVALIFVASLIIAVSAIASMIPAVRECDRLSKMLDD